MNIKKILIWVGIIFLMLILLGVVKNIRNKNKAQTFNVEYEKINIIGETSKSGVFDPSIEYNEDGTVGWMTYSPVENHPKDVSTALAKTTDNGKTWKKINTINQGVDGAVVLDGKSIQGTWRNEVSTLIHDIDDPNPDKRWKLIWHKYFVNEPYGDEDRLLEYGWVAYKYASSPEKLAEAEEIALFGAGKFPLEPYSAKINLNEMHKDLKNIITYTEPGMLYKDGVIYIAFQTFYVNFFTLKSNIVLISSNDHGETWKYLDTIIDEKDTKDFNLHRLGAPSLAQEDGKIFLLLSGLNNKAKLRDSTYIFEFENIKSGLLKRNENKKLILHKLLPMAMGGIMEGQADYDEYNEYGGIINSLVNSDDAPNFLGMYNTREKIID